MSAPLARPDRSARRSGPALAEAHAISTPPAVAASDAIDADERAEDEAILAADNIPEQRAWRAAWVEEQPDDRWTGQVREEVRVKAAGFLEGDVKLSELSCRETICRLYLQFADQLDAQAFISAPHEHGLHYEYQSLDPEFDGAGFDRSDYTYEVLIVRQRPAALPVRPGPAAPAAEIPANAVSASATGEGDERTRKGEVVMLGRAHSATRITAERQLAND